jgi:hypothetical protein
VTVAVFYVLVRVMSVLRGRRGVVVGVLSVLVLAQARPVGCAKVAHLSKRTEVHR